MAVPTTSPADTQSTSGKRRWLHIAGTVLGIVVILAVAQTLKRDGPDALEAWRKAHIQWPWILLASGTGLAGHVVYVAGWRRLLRDLGTNAPLWQLLRFLLVSNLGRYLPGGKAWQMGIVGVMAAENNLPAALLAATSLFQGAAGVAIGAALLIALGGAELGLSTVWVVIPLLGIVAMLALPMLLQAWPRARELVVRRLPGADTLTAGTMWAVIWTATVSWFAWGLALYCLARGLLPDPVASVISYTAAWIGPFLAGIVFIFVPAGIGVREKTMQTMLTASGLVASEALIVVFVARVWDTVLTVVPALLVLAIRKRRNRIER